MVKDIDFLELVKIVKDIENKNKKNIVNKDISYKPLDYEEVKSNLKKMDNLDKALSYIKMYELNYPVNSHFDLLDLFYLEGNLLNSLDYSSVNDNYNYNNLGTLNPYTNYISYKNFSQLELKRYFVNKQRLLDGYFIFTSSKFIYLLVNEIFRNVNNLSDNEGFELLMYLYIELVNLYSRNDKIFKPFIFEYLYTHNVDINKSYSRDDFINYFIKDNKIKLNIGYEDLIKYTILTSGYSFDEDEKDKLKLIFNLVNSYLTKENYSLSDLLYIKRKEINEYNYYNALMPMYDYSDKTINIDNIYNISFNKESYSYEKYLSTSEYYCFFRYIARRVKHVKNSHYVSINQNRISQILLNNDLNSEIEAICKGLVIIKEIRVNDQTIDEIIKSSNKVAEKLITDSDIEEIKEETTEISFDLKKYQEFLNLIIEDKSIKELNEYCNNHNEILDIYIDNINEASLNIIGDNIIYYDGMDIYIYEEYLNDVKEIIS